MQRDFDGTSMLKNVLLAGKGRKRERNSIPLRFVCLAFKVLERIDKEVRRRRGEERAKGSCKTF